MLLQKEREEVVRYGHELMRRGLTVGTFGNLSVYDPDGKVMAITPSGLDYGALTAEDIAVVTLDGVQVDGRNKPSSEVDMHRIFYLSRPDARAVVHTHSTYATVMACLGLPLEPIHYLIAYAGKDVPCIPYYPFGTQELAQAAYEGMGERNAVLLGNHGLLCVGPSLSYAMDAAEQLEFLARLCYQTRLLGGGVKLTEEQLNGVLGAFGHYRQG